MSDGRPDIIAIEPDDQHAKHVGWTTDGRQFILTTPFEPAVAGKPGNEFVALYVFDASGSLLDARITEFGPRPTMDRDKARQVYERYLKELGDVRLSRVEVAPFCITQFGVEFGLIAREPEDEEDAWAVEMQPGNYMAFFEPWNSGEYDT